MNTFYGINTSGDIHSIVVEGEMTPKIRAFASVNEWVIQETVEAPNGQNCDTSQFKYIDGVIVAKTAEEILQEQAPNTIRNLYQSALTQQNTFIDQNMRSDFLNDMFKWSNLADCPIALNYYTFRVAVWTQYHADKESLSDTFDYTTIIPEQEYSYNELEAEYMANKS